MLMLETVQKLKVLTKSRFKLALECPNKLFYTGKPEYANAKNDDSFLAALAEGGFQVEELARMHYPNGVFIDTDHGDYQRAAELTQNSLQKENVVIYEAAFLFDGLFIRTDILVKTGNHIKLIEVKAKSFDSSDPYLFIGKNGGIVSGWKPYLFDLAFQKYVVAKSHPEFRINAWLFMADKTKKASINGLNQLFRIPKNGNPRIDIIKKVNSLAEIGTSVLSEADVDGIINDIISNKHLYGDHKFEQAIESFRNAYQNNEFLNCQGNFSNCKNCEFKANSEDEAKGLKSGFKHCFSSMYHWKENDFTRPNAFEIWNYRGKAFNEENRLFLDDLTIDDFAVKPCAGKISASERQWIQLEKSLRNDTTVYVLKKELFEQMQSWKYPLHFIDFVFISIEKYTSSSVQKYTILIK
jgi:tetratricopeptide (TPR) repeat protein